MESVLYCILLTLLIAVCIKQGLPQNNVIILSSSKKIVQENSSVVLTCSSNISNHWSSRWETSYGDKSAQCVLINKTCTKTSFLNNNTLNDCICNSNGSYTVLLKHVDRDQHNSTWTCSNRFDTSNTVVINVSVPVTHAILTQSENEPMYENTSVAFTCTSSYSLPSAQIHWYRSYKSSTVVLTESQDVSLKRKTHTREDKVIRVTEILSYRVNRSVNSWSVYCAAKNWQSNVVMSDKIKLSVIYPPKTPIIKIHMSENNVEALSVVGVMENTNISLECLAESKPNSTFTWSRSMNEIIKDISKQMIVKHIQRNQSGTYTCHAENVMVRSLGANEIGRNNQSIYFDVLYPPDTPTFYHLENGNTQKLARYH